MNISILVFGNDNFLGTLPHQILDQNTFSLEVIADINQAKSRIQMMPPDILFLQANCDPKLELCYWLKEQVQLSWIHCILIEDRPQQLAAKCQNGWEWEFEMTSNALMQGADAYIWQLQEKKTDHNLIDIAATGSLILAQLEVGSRKAQRYRDLMKKNDFLSAIALADSLTELNNRRALEWDLPRQITKARDQDTSLSVIILDVDYFKKVNDNYGHLVGDRLLQLLSGRIRHNLRFQDTAFRYGGEEFVVILANTSSEEALVVAKRLNHIIGDKPFSINSKTTISVTISSGTASLRADDDDKGFSLLHRADQCLLRAKASGRNRVIAWEELSSVSHLEAISS